ncbi:MAG: pyridoxal phosphate-dependent aminotransferase [Phycisphaerales bacterium]
MPTTTTSPAAPHAATPFRSLPFMGVIRVNNEAMKIGWKMGDPAWTNLGQGMPEVGEIPGAPPRFNHFKIENADHAYGPVEGIPELRQAIADHYNRLFRKGKASQYTMENVAVAAGGRLALSRIGAALDQTRIGYFTPDYTAYEDLMTTFHRLDPVWIDLPASNGFKITPAELEQRVERDRIGALLISNPCNPTGVMIEGEELAAWVAIGRKRGTYMLMDEFYSHYHYKDLGIPASGPISTASHVGDVNADPVVIIDGLTKCYRYPGWRVGWVLAPKQVIHTLTAAGSFLDGGCSRPIQRAAIEVLKPERADQETTAVREVFAEKQVITVERLSELGITFPGALRGTFYAWGCVEKLPAPLNTGEGFMREAFKHRVLTVPGEFFDVNPHRSRTAQSSLTGFVRFSFGPPRDNLIAGLSRLAEMVQLHRS